jgi:hypothetical protein
MNDITRCGAAFVVLVSIGGANALAEPQAFPSPEAAAQALRDALEADDGEALRAIFGPEYADDLIGSDIAIVREGMRQTLEAMRAATALLPEADDSVILTIGRQAFPFPVPIVREGDSWRFDSASGLEEVLDRRIAWPADYGETRVMTFQVSHRGDVLEADLGPETAEVAAAIDAYDPDATWTEVTD